MILYHNRDYTLKKLLPKANWVVIKSEKSTLNSSPPNTYVYLTIHMNVSMCICKYIHNLFIKNNLLKNKREYNKTPGII